MRMESMLQVTTRLLLKLLEVWQNLELIYKEDCKSDHYFGQYARIIDRGKFIVYFPKNGELNVVDDETVEFELRHKIS